MLKAPLICRFLVGLSLIILTLSFLMRQFSTRSLTFLFALSALPGFGIWQAQAQTSMVNSLLPTHNTIAAPRSGLVTSDFSQSIMAASAPNLRVYGSQVRGSRPGTISGGGTAKLMVPHLCCR